MKVARRQSTRTFGFTLTRCRWYQEGLDRRSVLSIAAFRAEVVTFLSFSAGDFDRDTMTSDPIAHQRMHFFCAGGLGTEGSSCDVLP